MEIKIEKKLTNKELLEKLGLEMKEERFYLDNTNHIIDFDDSCDKYCLEYEEVVKLLNDFKEENAILKRALELKVKKQLENVLYVWIDNKCFSNEQDLINYWVEQAKESMK